MWPKTPGIFRKQWALLYSLPFRLHPSNPLACHQQIDTPTPRSLEFDRHRYPAPSFELSWDRSRARDRHR
jgi:hypothetical protein